MAEEKTPGLSAAFSPKKLWEFVGIILVTTIVWNYCCPVKVLHGKK